MGRGCVGRMSVCALGWAGVGCVCADVVAGPRRCVGGDGREYVFDCCGGGERSECCRRGPHRVKY